MSNGKLRIAIHENNTIFNHSTTWTNPWIQCCKELNIEFEVVDCYDYKIVEKLMSFDVLLWHFANYAYQDMKFARSILYTAKRMGLKVFPDFNDSWHFDDKLAETYLLQSINAPIPKSWMFYTSADFTKWISNEVKFPLVAKLISGSGSHNVKLINNINVAKRYAKKMFGKGFSPAPSIGFKATSQLKSSKSIKDIKKRLKRLPEFIHTLMRAKKFANEKGYVYFQEFTPNDGFDLKIVVIGDKISYLGRNIRKDDFRASGGGSLFYDKSLVSKDIIDSAFKTSDMLDFQCMGYDYVVDKRNNKGIIIEMSYGFSHVALLGANGYWDRNGNWFDEPLNAPREIILNIVHLLEIER